MIIFSVDESGKSIVKLEGKSGKIIAIGCCFPPEFANSGTLLSTSRTRGTQVERGTRTTR